MAPFVVVLLVMCLLSPRVAPEGNAGCGCLVLVLAVLCVRSCACGDDAPAGGAVAVVDGGNSARDGGVQR